MFFDNGNCKKRPGTYLGRGLLSGVTSGVTCSPASGEFTYANAGHNPPLLLRSRTQEIERLEKGGMALGVLPENQIKERQVTLQGGDCVVFYTDGLTDALSPQGNLYEEKKLLTAVRAAPRDSAQALLEALDRSVHEHISTASPVDDLTLIVLRRAQDEPSALGDC